MSPEMVNLQSARLIIAATEVLQEVGYERLTVGLVIGRAGVSRKTFYDLFANCEDCFLAVLEQAADRARKLATDAYAQQRGWREGIRAALENVLLLMEEDLELTRLCLVESLCGGPRIHRFREELLQDVAKALDRARDAPGALRDPPTITAEALTGGIFLVLHNRLLDEREEPLADLLAALMSMVTLPYLGARTAARELNKPGRAPAQAWVARPSRIETDPLQGLNIRLTYRTVCALAAIAGSPGARNCDIALAAGVVDQGQISKLLNRLSRAGLIENTGRGHTEGAANAWWLTERGGQLYRAAWPR
ncbi:MAG TPA: TetR/AcrR family transcriptional regulator [Solirubrobacteraceae bacterium]|nr:TetR/AcrR family transcriptional regulator [Solirubrobacteraceae bacterium]